VLTTSGLLTGNLLFGVVGQPAKRPGKDPKRT
jgi:hypothetical protein